MKNKRINIEDYSDDELENISDDEVETLITTWDIVECAICGKEISMLDAVLINEGSKFICRRHK